MDHLKISITVGEFAQLVGLSVRRIQQLSDEGIIPKDERGKYVISEAIPAFINHQRSMIEKKGDVDYERARAQKMRAMAEIAEIELAVKKGELVRVEIISEQIKKEYGYVREKLLAIPSKISLQLCGITEPGDIQKKLDKSINDALSDMQGDLIGS
jgi:phage terminase Nu1 subunit (DNA packaging protein)